MKVDVDIETDINVPETMQKIRDPKFQTFAAMEWYKLYRDFCPRDTGVLYDNAIIGPFKITHYAPYAKTVYEHNRNYRKDKAGKASAHWDRAAAPSQKPKLIQSMQNYIDSGRLNLNDK